MIKVNCVQLRIKEMAQEKVWSQPQTNKVEGSMALITNMEQNIEDQANFDLGFATDDIITRKRKRKRRARGGPKA